jgi:hypothetical protein
VSRGGGRDAVTRHSSKTYNKKAEQIKKMVPIMNAFNSMILTDEGVHEDKHLQLRIFSLHYDSRSSNMLEAY